MNKISKNKGIFYIVILLILIGVGLYLKQRKTNTIILPPNKQVVEPTQEKNIPLISITDEKINEKNFTGSMAKISGDSLLATAAQNYITQTVADFKKEADVDVPDIREKFGADSPVSQYEIDVSAKYIKNKKTESIAMQTYTYTGGAHGNSLYKVITSSLVDGKILSLSDVINKDKQKAFVEFVKKELLKWQPEGRGGLGVFPENVQSLTFDSFNNWSLSDKNLTFYFDQYAIGPAALGSVEFPLSVSKLTNFLK